MSKATPRIAANIIKHVRAARKVSQLVHKLPSKKTANRGKHIADIAKSYGNGRLVLVLGAGVSVECGFPDWTTLLQRLLLTSITHQGSTPAHAHQLARIFTKTFAPNPLIAARYLQQEFEVKQKLSPVACLTLVRNSLYQNRIKSAVPALVREITNFCVAAGKRPNLDCIITYNYDDVIEKALSEPAVPYRSIHAPGMNAAQDELAIYHVHGFLPEQGPLGKAHEITLCDHLYHQQYGEVYRWSNLVQINKLKDSHCLFIGVSFSDPNLRRILDIARIQRGSGKIAHHIFRRRYSPQKIEEKLRSLLTHDPEFSTGGKRRAFNLKRTTRELIEMTEKFEELDATSFGVATIWIDDFGEIPTTMAQIRAAARKQ